MGTPQERSLGRREFLSAGGTALASGYKIITEFPRVLTSGIVSAAIAACQPVSAEQDKYRELFKWKEREEKPSEGDVIIVDGRPYLFRRNVRFIIPDLGKYTHNSKLDKYGGRIFNLPGEEYRRYPIINPADYSNNLDWLIDLQPDLQDKAAIRRRIDNKIHYGGEMLVFFPGFMTDDGDVFDVAKPRQDTFTTLIRGLMPRGWGYEDCLFFNYGEKLWVDSYDTKSTARSPEQNIKFARQFLQRLKEEFPLLRFNVVGHSLGAVLALAAVMEHHDAVNNLVLLNGPINGIEGDLTRRALVAGLKNSVFRVSDITDEQVTGFLFDLWDDKRHRENVENFMSYLRRIKRGATVMIDEGDMIVPPEAALSQNAEVIRLRSEGRGSAIDMAKDLPKVLEIHGRLLKYIGSIEHVGQKFGEDLADAA